MANIVSLATGAMCTVLAQQDADFYASVFGDDPVVLPIGSQCAVSSPTASTVTVADGIFLIQGRQVHITTDDFTIPLGTAKTHYGGYRIYTEEGEDKLEQFVSDTYPTNSGLMRDGTESAYGVLFVAVTSSTAITSVYLYAQPTEQPGPRVIFDEGDLNDITAPGKYILMKKQSNAPSGTAGSGFLEVTMYRDRFGTDSVRQVYHPYTENTPEAKYNRIKVGSDSWPSWAGGNAMTTATTANTTANNNSKRLTTLESTEQGNFSWTGSDSIKLTCYYKRVGKVCTLTLQWWAENSKYLSWAAWYKMGFGTLPKTCWPFNTCRVKCLTYAKDSSEVGHFDFNVSTAGVVSLTNSSSSALSTMAHCVTLTYVTA